MAITRDNSLALTGKKVNSILSSISKYPQAVLGYANIY